MRRSAALWGVPALLLLTFCSLQNVDYLRDEACAPNCGLDGDSGTDAPSGDVRTDALPACSAAMTYREVVLCDKPTGYFRLGDQGPPKALNQVEGGAPGTYMDFIDGGFEYGVEGAVPGDQDTAVRFDDNGWISAGGAFAFGGKAPFSLEVWVRPEGNLYGQGVYRRIIERVAYGKDGLPRDGYLLFNGATCTFSRNADGGDTYIDGPALSNTGYNHVVATFDGGMIKLYINSDLIPGSAVATESLDDAPATFFIGGYGQSVKTGGGWIGTIDEVAIYDYALDASQIANHYERGGGR